jgi:hypothetical protein
MEIESEREQPPSIMIIVQMKRVTSKMKGKSRPRWITMNRSKVYAEESEACWQLEAEGEGT